MIWVYQQCLWAPVDFTTSGAAGSIDFTFATVASGADALVAGKNLYQELQMAHGLVAQLI